MSILYISSAHEDFDRTSSTEQKTTRGHVAFITSTIYFSIQRTIAHREKEGFVILQHTFFHFEQYEIDEHCLDLNKHNFFQRNDRKLPTKFSNYNTISIVRSIYFVGFSQLLDATGKFREG